MSRIPVIALFGPVVGGPNVGEADGPDPLEVLDAVLDRDDQPERCAVLGGQRLAVHLVAEQGLGMEGAGHVEPDVVAAVGCLERGVVEQALALWAGQPLAAAGRQAVAVARSASRAPAQCTTSLQPSMQRSSVVISTRGKALISSSVNDARLNARQPARRPGASSLRGRGAIESRSSH